MPCSLSEILGFLSNPGLCMTWNIFQPDFTVTLEAVRSVSLQIRETIQEEQLLSQSAQGVGNTRAGPLQTSVTPAQYLLDRRGPAGSSAKAASSHNP